MLSIRPATENDVHRIIELYNDSILYATATFDTELKSNSERIKWFVEHGQRINYYN